MMLLTCWDCTWVSFEQPQRQSEHILGCHQIHNLPAEWRAGGELCQHMPGPFWPSLLTTFSICDFLLFPEFKTALQGRIFNNITISKHNTGCTFSASNSALHKMLCPVVLSQGSLYEVPRRLRMVCCYAEINSVQKLSDWTTYWIDVWNRYHAEQETDHSHPSSTANYEKMGHYLYYALSLPNV